MARRYWLMKCEPAAYTIDDLRRDGQTSWEGVRNYQARNFMRDDHAGGRRRAVLRVERQAVRGDGHREGLADRLSRSLRLGAGTPLLRRPQHARQAALVHGGHRVRRALSGDHRARDAEGHPGARGHGGHEEGQPAVCPAGDQGGVRRRAAPRQEAGRGHAGRGRGRAGGGPRRHGDCRGQGGLEAWPTPGRGRSGGGRDRGRGAGVVAAVGRPGVRPRGARVDPGRGDEPAGGRERGGRGGSGSGRCGGCPGSRGRRRR